MSSCDGAEEEERPALMGTTFAIGGDSTCGISWESWIESVEAGGVSEWRWGRLGRPRTRLPTGLRRDRSSMLEDEI